MQHDAIDWAYVQPTDFILWYRTRRRLDYWRAFAIGSYEICAELASSMHRAKPLRSILILPYRETPVMEVV